MADSGMGGEPRSTKRKAESAPGAEPHRIKALDANVVNKIAAGEIITAPVQALKELVENAVDAGATALEVLAKDGGLKLLQITDNGCGIDKDDLDILCERFTTSKLKTFEDLDSIATYGFRGEALASISHIAHLTVTTRTAHSDTAWRACYEAGRLAPSKPGQSAEPKRVAGRPGTQITVEDLFYNVPTRRRAFRSPADEYNKMVDVLGRYAVHCHQVAFSCKKQGEASASIAVPAAASTVDRIRHVYGSAVAKELLSFSLGGDDDDNDDHGGKKPDTRWGFTAHGMASNANYSMKRTTLLLFINHRCVESSNIRKAIDETYAAFLPKNGHPFVYLSLDIDPQRVDVNVHPTKKEVHFLNEEEITRAVCEHISSKLAAVDTSRTFVTQTLLPGWQTAANYGKDKDKENETDPDYVPATTTTTTTAMATPAKKTRPYENNLVRTDTNLRKITSMFTTATPMSPGTPSGTPSRVAPSQPSQPSQPPPPTTQPPPIPSYDIVPREATANWLKSVRELKEAVVADADAELTDLFKQLTYVGLVDERRRLAAFQSGVKLYLVDYGRACCALLYQLGLADFGNFGVLRFQPPLDLRGVVSMEVGDDDDADTDAGKAKTEAVVSQLIERRQMLLEYFSLEVTPSGELLSLPLLLRGYTPPLAKLPQFLARLGPAVVWTDEKRCFETFLRELARFYVPEPLPVDSGEGEEDDSLDDDLRARRAHVRHAIEHVFFPAFKSQLVCTTSLMREGIIEVANLKGLYRVFERC